MNRSASLPKPLSMTNHSRFFFFLFGIRNTAVLAFVVLFSSLLLRIAMQIRFKRYYKSDLLSFQDLGPVFFLFRNFNV